MLTATRSRALTIRAARSIVLAMFFGLATFASVALAVSPLADDEPDPRLRTILLGLTGLALVTSVPLAFVVRARGVASAARRRTEALAELARGELPPELGTATTTAGALVEGAGLLGIVTFFLTRELLALGALAVPLLVLMFLLPTAERLAEGVRAAA
jgi:hypothetical protein